eukprot:TRINITY_DN11955_c0_g1_i1.p2 TRINITY_DN11955_c0_g1~~TRINITY_DN11955_c0_g1_i1.p2  ORF type:complete len:279 (-),score=83.25 TRINITY_DN11955_c0_g1_i1:61-897(-)
MGDATYWKEEGNRKLKEGNREEALSCYANGIRAADQEIEAFHGSPDDLETKRVLFSQLCSNRAHVLILLEQYESAIEDCRHAVDVDPRNTKGYWRGATAALKLGRSEDAAELLRQGLRDAYGTPNGSGLVELMGKSFDVWEKAATQGAPACQYLLGLAYIKGNGASKDLDRGFALMRQAAEQGDEMAEKMLEELRARQEEQEKKQCAVQAHTVEVWSSAAAAGDPAAQFNLGLAYLKGEGVPQDQGRCIDLWTRAAEQGDEMAQRNLAALIAERQRTA